MSSDGYESSKAVQLLHRRGADQAAVRPLKGANGRGKAAQVASAHSDESVSEFDGNVDGGAEPPNPGRGETDLGGRIRSEHTDDEELWELPVSCSDTDSSSDLASRDKPRPPPLAYQQPTPLRKNSTTVLSPNALANTVTFGYSSDEDDGESDTPRERETIDPTELPVVGEKIPANFLRGSILQWAPPPPRPRATKNVPRERGRGRGRGKRVDPAPPDADSIASFVDRMSQVGVVEERALAHLAREHYAIDRAESALRELTQSEPGPVPSAVCFHTIDFARWTAEEEDDFDKAFVRSGKQFRDVSAAIGTKSIRHCVEYYYRWKKTQRGVATQILRRDALSLPIPVKIPNQMFVPMSCLQRRALPQKPLSHKKKKSHKKRVPDSHEREEAINGTKRVREDSQTAPGDQEAESQIGRDAKRRREESPLNGMPHASSRAEPSQLPLKQVPKKKPPSPPARAPLPPKPPQKQRNKKPRPSPPRDDPDVFTVEAIVAQRVKGKKREVQVKWEGYGHEDNTWEPEENLANNTIWKEWKRRTTKGRRKP
eukprot:m.135518 g.135518  ORF g.135518 m.135518 type:complete len:543 (+) comp13907_c0_seq3:3418-5046(+)